MRAAARRSRRSSRPRRRACTGSTSSACAASNPAYSEVLVAILAAQVRRLSAHLARRPLRVGRQARAQRLAEIAALYARDGSEIDVPLTQEDLAGLAGTWRATVNRVLRAEQERGTVRLSRGRTVVLDRDALSRP